MSNVFVFRPGATPQFLNVFDDWGDLVAKLAGIDGRKIIEFDDSIMTCVIPPAASPYEMRDVSWAGFGPRDAGRPRAVVEISDGASFSNLRMLGGQIAIVNKATTASPIADFGPAPPGVAHQVQVGMRDDGGSTHIVNQGSRPLFEINATRAVFFLQNCLFGVSALNQVSTSPVVHVNGNGSLTLNLLAQSSLGPDVVRADSESTVLFGAISFAAQIAADQTQATSPNGVEQPGVLRISPLGRIQRGIVPMPPAPSVVASNSLNGLLSLPNALIRCDGQEPNKQELPKIIGKFKGIPGNYDLYTGGQELVVAEVEGGHKLSVAPASGDTIDGTPDPVKIGAHGSRTFVSDGKSNWITISIVRSPP